MSEDPSAWRDYHNPYWRPGQDSPRQHSSIWIWREGWSAPQLTSNDKLNPMMNVVGLKWKPAEELN